MKIRAALDHCTASASSFLTLAFALSPQKPPCQTTPSSLPPLSLSPFLSSHPPYSPSLHPPTKASKHPQANNIPTQYFKSIETVAASQNITQTLPPATQLHQKRDSVITALNTPTTPSSPARTSLLPPIYTQVDSTKAPEVPKVQLPPTPAGSPDQKVRTWTGNGDAAGDGSGIERALTPELVPDRMADRLVGTPEIERELHLGGLVAGDVSLQRMGERI